jgi:hypothetical protein
MCWKTADSNRLDGHPISFAGRKKNERIFIKALPAEVRQIILGGHLTFEKIFSFFAAK